MGRLFNKLRDWVMFDRHLSAINCDPVSCIILGAPKDWDESRDGPCDGLPVYAYIGDNPSFCSIWRPTWRQRLALAMGVNIALHVIGRGHPPVALTLTTLQEP